MSLSSRKTISVGTPRTPKGGVNDAAILPTNDVLWKERRADCFGYSGDEERRAKRGLEEWEMVEEDDRSAAHVDDGSRKWLVITLCSATILSMALYLFGVEITPAEDNQWFLGTYREEIFSVIFFFVFLYVSMVIKLIYDNKKEGGKTGERIVLIGVLIGGVLAIAMGIMQVFVGYLL